MLYTLTPGLTSSFKQIRMCPELCPGTQESDFPLVMHVADEDAVLFQDPFIVLQNSVSLSVRTAAISVSLLLTTALTLALF